VSDGTVRKQTVDPTTIGLARVELEALRGGDAEHNAAVARDVFAGAAGPVRDAVLLNAAGALVAHRRSAGPDLHENLREQIAVAADAIDSGAATTLLDNWVRVSNTV
jgi:anthranilate phosphoribosyltransferase